MMLEEHKVETETGDEFTPCGWCHKAHEGYMPPTFEDPLDSEVCRDPRVARIFHDIPCDCGSHDGIIMMYPHTDGVRLLGKEGKYWIYRKCDHCGHQLSLLKAQSKAVNLVEGIQCSH